MSVGGEAHAPDAPTEDRPERVEPVDFDAFWAGNVYRVAARGMPGRPI